MLERRGTREDNHQKSMPVEIVANPGHLPPFWDRSVLFFSNIHSIFYDNVQETEHLLNAIAGANSYGGRLLAIIDLLFRGGSNAVFLESQPDPGLVAYLKEHLGLSVPRFAIMDAETYDRLRRPHNRPARAEELLREYQKHPAEWVDGYVTDTGLSQIADRLGKRTISSVAGSRRGNNKYLLHQHLAQQGLPTFDTLTASHAGELQPCLEKLEAHGYTRAVIKSQIGASGFGMEVVHTTNPILDTVGDYLFFEGPCLVQGWLGEEVRGVRHVGSPSVQFFVAEDRIFLFDITEQVLSHESVHQGNAAPPLYLHCDPGLEPSLLHQAGVAAAWIHGQGYRGTGSVDFLIIERAATGLETIVCEVNARVTGATYPALLARHFKPGHAWMMRNISFRRPVASNFLLWLMRRKGLLYDPEATTGILPFNFNTNQDRKVIKGQFLFLAESCEECLEILARAESILRVGWEYDRD